MVATDIVILQTTLQLLLRRDKLKGDVWYGDNSTQDVSAPLTKNQLLIGFSKGPFTLTEICCGKALAITLV